MARVVFRQKAIDDLNDIWNNQEITRLQNRKTYSILPFDYSKRNRNYQNLT